MLLCFAIASQNISWLLPIIIEQSAFSDRSLQPFIVLPNYRKIPKINPRAYIFQRPFLRGLFLEGLIHGGKFAFQNRLGKPYSWK